MPGLLPREVMVGLIAGVVLLTCCVSSCCREAVTGDDGGGGDGPKDHNTTTKSRARAAVARAKALLKGRTYFGGQFHLQDRKVLLDPKDLEKPGGLTPLASAVWWRDLCLYELNNHELLSMMFSDRHHPLSLGERRVAFVVINGMQAFWAVILHVWLLSRSPTKTPPRSWVPSVINLLTVVPLVYATRGLLYYLYGCPCLQVAARHSSSQRWRNKTYDTLETCGRLASLPLVAAGVALVILAGIVQDKYRLGGVMFTYLTGVLTNFLESPFLSLLQRFNHRCMFTITIAGGWLGSITVGAWKLELLEDIMVHEHNAGTDTASTSRLRALVASYIGSHPSLSPRHKASPTPTPSVVRRALQPELVAWESRCLCGLITTRTYALPPDVAQSFAPVAARAAQEWSSSSSSSSSTLFWSTTSGQDEDDEAFFSPVASPRSAGTAKHHHHQSSDDTAGGGVIGMTNRSAEASKGVCTDKAPAHRSLLPPSRMVVGVW